MISESTKSEAIAFFENIKKEYDEWYMKKDRVSIVMMGEREDLIYRCNWAIRELKGVK